jgi:hypothetical protein
LADHHPAGLIIFSLWRQQAANLRKRIEQAEAEIAQEIRVTDRDTDLLRRYRSAKPLRRELLLAGMAAATFILWYFDLTPYPLTRTCSASVWAC